MAYMSKTKRRRVRKQNLIRLAIAIAVIIAILIIIWQISLGSVIARVEGTPIRSSMVNGVETFIEYLQTGQFSGNAATGDDKALQEDMSLVQRNSIVYSVFVAKEVLKKHFEAEGIIFPNEEQQIAIDEYVSSYLVSPEAVRSLESNGVKKEHIQYYYEYLTIMSAFRDIVSENNPVTDEEALDYYNENQDYFINPFSMRASHILIYDPEHTDENRTKIEQILDMLNNGEDFAELAMEYSDDSSAENGGDLGTFGLGEMVPEFENAAFALEPGEISGIVETEYGFHIIKLTEKTEESIVPIEDVRESIDSYLLNLRSTEAMEELIEAANITYYGLINPTTGRPPTSLAELDEARGIADNSDDPDNGDHEGHDHD